jgi:hypothetical protein
MKISAKTLHRTQRFNCGSLRRYFHPSGAIIVTNRDPTKTAAIIPASCHHISVTMPRADIIPFLREIRATRRATHV